MARATVPIILFLGLFTFLSSCDKGETESPENETKTENTDPICGCMDSEAVNYNPDATCDDGLCVNLTSEQNTLGILFTSTGCNGCGTWGIKCFEGIVKRIEKGVIPVTAHWKYGDPMTTDMSKAWVEHFRPRFSPYFVTGTDHTIDISTGCPGSETNANEVVETHLAQTPVFNMGTSHQVLDNKIHLTVGYELLKADDAESYSIAAFVLEDEIIVDQSIGWKKWIYDFEHTYTLRTGFTEFDGVAISTDESPSGYRDFELPIGEEWNSENIYTVSVIWLNKSDGSKEIVNAISTR